MLSPLVHGSPTTRHIWSLPSVIRGGQALSRRGRTGSNMLRLKPTWLHRLSLPLSPSSSFSFSFSCSFSSFTLCLRCPKSLLPFQSRELAVWSLFLGFLATKQHVHSTSAKDSHTMYARHIHGNPLLGSAEASWKTHTSAHGQHVRNDLTRKNYPSPGMPSMQLRHGS